MFFKNHLVKLAILSIVLGGSTAVLNATYYEPDFFPIGLTGLGQTKSGWNYDNSCPYKTAGDGWTWDDPEKNNEQDLIYALGVNCVGCEDAKK